MVDPFEKSRMEVSMSKSRILLAGESWVSTSTHIKGFDQFNTAAYEIGAEALLAVFEGTDTTIEHLPAHDVGRLFPMELEALQHYDAVLLSDIGANSLLLHPDTWSKGKRTPNRLKLLREYVESGGGLAMIGGYYSFQGINGAARYHGTPVEEILPVEILAWDDRIEVPEGFQPHLTGEAHPIVDGFTDQWPFLLGFNEVKPKLNTKVLATVGQEYDHRPLIVVGSYGKGRTMVWTSDIGPHWLPEDFMNWEGYGRLWQQSFAWLAGSETN